ncbi:MAG: cation diffusion facilitator family transporter [Bacilli bacterium]|nr:cation diffusion facilitator family transporter [Mycoplasmatota bacterium]MEE0015434.1 cation diffusion facilitator family transporter [Bacilli bacterium]
MKFKEIKKASLFGVFGNLFLLLIKGIVGFISGSQAMIADAFNSASDILSSIMTFFGQRIASKPKDEDHNLGHGKAEYIYSMLISIIMIIMVFKVFKDSIVNLFTLEKATFTPWLIVVCALTIIIKIGLFLYTNRLYKKNKSLLLKANRNDHRNDCILTSLNLIACVLGYYGIYFVDSVAGIFISIWIFIVAYKIFIESYDILMDKSIDDETKEKVYKVISAHKEIKKISHFNSTPVGYMYQISFTIFVDGNLSTFDSHEIANNLEKEIDKKFPEIYLTVIHVNPMDVK